MSPMYGKRLIVSLIDQYAADEPEKLYASVPRNEEDLSQGFKDITYSQLANAINHASWWLESTLGKSYGNFETFAYVGPKDLMYPILAVAAAKVGRQILLPSPFATKEAQLHVLHTTKCRAYLHSQSMTKSIKGLLGEPDIISRITVPELHQWMSVNVAQVYVYQKSWEEAKYIPWIIYHSSGTTGLPKPLSYDNFLMTSLDAARTMPGVDEEGLLETHFIKARFYTPLPTLHLIGMLLALQMTVFLSTVMVMGPASVLPPTADTVAQIIRHGGVESSLMPPSLIEDLCADPGSLELIRKQLKYMDFAGAPLPKRVGDLLAPYLRLMPGIGSTEAGPCWPRARNDDANRAEDWKWYSFRSSMGIFFEQRTKAGLYELVFRRRKGCERWQQIFHMYPDLDEYPTKDLWAKHPTREGLWEFAGRMDDLVILSHGEDLFASKIERVIERDARIKTALIGGEGRKRPFLILELVEGIVNSAGPANSALATSIWPSIEKANEFCSEYVRLSRELTIFASASKPLMRTAKDTVARRDSLALYAEEIIKLYTLVEEMPVAANSALQHPC